MRQQHKRYDYNVKKKKKIKLNIPIQSDILLCFLILINRNIILR